jgi:two-component system, chemotaxis family, CheB/CheR fusion protein
MTASVVNLSPSAQRKRRVLVVEDNLDAVRMTATLLRLIGHEVEFAINGFAAIDIARKFKPDIILLDIGLPDFKGDQLAKQLRYEPGLEKTRFIAITGQPLSLVEDRAREAGCEAVYAKPIAPDVLEKLVAKD